MGVDIRAHEGKHRRQQQEGCEIEGDATESPVPLGALYLYGDVLESVVERVPASDLAAAAWVSREWLRAVRSALRRRPRRLPWLVVHLRGHRRRTTAAYDPHTGTWLTVQAPRHATPSHVRLVRGARGDRVCALSFSGLDVAGDPLGTSACVTLKAPAVWRVDPVFAAVGDRVVALGGACRLALAEGEDAAAVEVHENGSWTTCDPMPAALRESAAATWLSTATTDQRVYLVDRATGWASWFDPSKRRWGPVRQLRPDARVSTWGVAPRRGAGAERLVLFGAKREENNVVIQTWEVDGDALDLSTPGAANDDAMPREMSERLFPRDEDEEDDEEMFFPSIGVCGNAVGGYVYNAAELGNGAVLYELREGRQKGRAVERWEWVPCAPCMRADPLGRAILACSPVGLDELVFPSRACKKRTLKC